MNIYVPAQRPAPDQEAATAAPAPEAEALGWGRVLRLTVARASLAMVVSLVIWSLLPLLAGWTPRVIMSGSMEPRIHVGDIVVTRTVPGASVTKGQVITVKDPDHPAKTRTHRVLRRAADGTIVTKGDANPQADSSHISNENVLGVGVVRVPYVGRPAYWMAEQNWLALGATSLFLGWCLITVLPGSRKPEDTDGDDQAGPSGETRRYSRSRRAAATVAVAAMVVGAATGPGRGRVQARRRSTPPASGRRPPRSSATPTVLGRLPLVLLAPGREQWIVCGRHQERPDRSGDRRLHPGARAVRSTTEKPNTALGFDGGYVNQPPPSPAARRSRSRRGSRPPGAPARGLVSLTTALRPVSVRSTSAPTARCASAAPAPRWSPARRH